MISSALLLASLCATAVYGIQDDPGPQYFAQSTPSPALLKSGYVMKDVVLYLTPSQIRALEATQGLNKVIPFGKPRPEERIKFSNEDLHKLEAELNRQLEQLRILEKQHERQVQFKAPPPPPPIVEPNTEKPIAFAPQTHEERQQIPQLQIPQLQSPQLQIPQLQIPQLQIPQLQSPQLQSPQLQIPLLQSPQLQSPQLQIPQLQIPRLPIQYQPEVKYIYPSQQELKVRLPESYSYIKFYTDSVAQEKPRIQAFKPIPHALRLGGELLEKNLEVQKDPLHQNQYKLIPYEYVAGKNEEQLKQELLTQVPQWPSLFNQLHSEPPQNQQFTELLKAQNQESLSEVRYAAKFKDHKQAADYQRFVAKIQKENALAQADALKKSPPEVVKKEESIKKRKPTSFLKQFSTPVFKPFYVVGSPLGLKVPQQYQIPEVIQTNSTPKPESLENPKEISLEVERYVPAELKKNEEFEISIDNPEKTTTLRHIWKN